MIMLVAITFMADCLAISRTSTGGYGEMQLWPQADKC
jgi:hypothetical protein